MKCLQEVVADFLFFDDNAIQPAPISLPTPALLRARGIVLNIGSCKLSGQGLVAPGAPRRSSPAEPSTAITGLNVRFHLKAHRLLAGATWKFRHALVPHGKNRCLAARVAITVDAISESAMPKPVSEGLLAMFALPDALLSCHGLECVS